ncbi:MAG: hypothetical protein ACKN9D_18775 [Actinomycetales bacterium]
MARYIRLPCWCGSRSYEDREVQGRVEPFCAACGRRLAVDERLTVKTKVLLWVIGVLVAATAIAITAALAPWWWTVGVSVAIGLVFVLFVLSQVL